MFSPDKPFIPPYISLFMQIKRNKKYFGEWNLTNLLPISISKYSSDVYLLGERQIKGKLRAARDSANHDQTSTGDGCLTTQARPDLTSKTTNQEENILEKTGFKFDHPDRKDIGDIKKERAIETCFFGFYVFWFISVIVVGCGASTLWHRN